MAYDSEGLKMITPGGAVGTAPENVKNVYHYATNDTVATVVASGYFNNEADLLNIGDLILVSADLDGTPDTSQCVIATNDGTTVTTAT